MTHQTKPNILDYVGYDGELIFPLTEDGSIHIPVEEGTDKSKFKHGSRPLYLTMDIPAPSEPTQFIVVAQHQGQLMNPRVHPARYVEAETVMPSAWRDMLMESILIGLLLFLLGAMILMFVWAFHTFI